MGRDWVIREDVPEISLKAMVWHAKRRRRSVDDTLLARSQAIYREIDTWLKARAVKGSLGGADPAAPFDIAARFP